MWRVKPGQSRRVPLRKHMLKLHAHRNPLLLVHTSLMMMQESNRSLLVAGNIIQASLWNADVCVVIILTAKIPPHPQFWFPRLLLPVDNYNLNTAEEKKIRKQNHKLCAVLSLLMESYASLRIWLGIWLVFCTVGPHCICYLPNNELMAFLIIRLSQYYSACDQVTLI